MTNEQKMKQTDTKEFAKIIYDFTIGFMTESIDGICDIECKNSPNSCEGCIERWLQQEIK